MAKSDTEYDDSQSSVVEVSQEVWRDKNVDVLESKKVVRSKRRANSILEKAKPFTSHIPILPNGSTTTGNKKKPTIISHNTCPFDVLFQIFSALYKDVPQLAQIIDISFGEFDMLIRDSFTINSMNELIEQRSQLVCSLFPNRVVNGAKNIKIIDLFMCINEMFIAIASKSNVVYSLKIRKSCRHCKNISEEKENYIPMKFRGNWKDILENLEAYVIIDKEPIEICEDCSSNLDVTYI